jgi:hypothetical protein
MVAYLRVPSIGEEEEVGTVKEDVERWQAGLRSAGQLELGYGALLTETSWGQELRSKPLGDAHCNIRDGLLEVVGAK